MAVSELSHVASSAVDELYRRHGSEVYRYAYAVVGNHADAEDVTQTTFLNAYRALEQGVRPRKPSNWLLAIASNAIKQRFRQEQARPRYVELDDRTAGSEPEETEGPSVGELLAALSKIPPQQRQALVLREFEGRSYAEIAEILGVTTGALETLLFRARRSLAEELEHRLTCTEAQLAVSRATDGRLGRKERRRLRDHLAECPDCSHFARVQQRHRRALKGLMLLPVPLSLSFLKGIEGQASAAALPAGVSTAAVGAGVGMGAGGGGVLAGGGGGLLAGGGGGLLAGGVAAKAAAVVAAATVAGGVVVAGSSELRSRGTPPIAPGTKVGQVAPRGVLVPGNGVAVGKATAPGQAKTATRRARLERAAAARAARLHGRAATAKAHAVRPRKPHPASPAPTRPIRAPKQKVERTTPTTPRGSAAPKTGTTSPESTAPKKDTTSSSAPDATSTDAATATATATDASAPGASAAHGGQGGSKKP